MAEYCSMPIPREKSIALDGLRNFCGTNVTKFNQLTYDTIVQNADGTYGFTEEFSNWFKETYPREHLSINSSNPVILKSALVRYYNKTKRDYHETVTPVVADSQVKMFGYASVADRNYCLRAAGNIILMKSISLPAGQTAGRDWYENTVSDYVRNQLLRRIRVKTNKDSKEIIQGFNKEGIDYIREQLGGKNITEQDANLLALYAEMKVSRSTKRELRPIDDIFKIIFANPNLSHLRFDNLAKPNTENPTEEALAQQDYVDEESGDELFDMSTSDIVDTIGVYNNHHGLYPSFIKHVNTKLRTYLASLRKIKSLGTVNGDLDYDLDNPLGLPEHFDVAETMLVLYTSGVDYTSTTTMLFSIQKLARELPGYLGLQTLVNDCFSDSDLAFEVYRTFSKAVFSKMQTTTNNGELEAEESNKQANRKDALNFEYLNSAKRQVLNVDEVYVGTKLQALVDKLNSEEYKGYKKHIGPRTKKAYDAFKTDLIANTFEVIKYYYPTVTEGALKNYIYNAGESKNEVDKLSENIGKLVAILNKCIEGTRDSQVEYTNRIASYVDAINKNKAYKKASSRIDPNVLIDTDAILNQEYVSPAIIQASSELATQMCNYAVVKTQLNSPNVLGNLSSDVINSSYMTGFMKMLQHHLNTTNVAASPLYKYGQDKCKTSSYQYSNILIEHKDDNGNIINYGLFRKNNDEWVPTEYATELLKISLFDGASDLSAGTNITYNQMTQGDYIPTAFINFFSEAKEKKNIAMAKYFMRIPADAPKIFVVTAPKYSINSVHNSGKLFTVENEKEISTYVNNKLRSFKKATGFEYINLRDNARPVTIEELVQTVMTGTSPEIRVDKRDITYEEDGKSYVDCVYNVDAETNQHYAISGKVVERNGVQYLTEIEFVGFIESGTSKEDITPADSATLVKEVENAIKKEIKKQGLKNGEIAEIRNVNRNHPIFKQFESVFMKELTDMATAINVIYETDATGNVVRDENDNPKFREDNPVTVREGYEGYHSDGKQFHKGDKFNEKPTGRVFTSNKFTIFNKEAEDLDADERQENYVESMFNGNANDNSAINFLYGGASNSYLHFEKNADGKVSKVYLTPAQQEEFESRLEKYIIALSNDARRRIDVFSSFINEDILTDDNIDAFIINHALAYMNFDDLFEGNTKFYGTTQDFFKRSKETQGSGVPFGIVNINGDRTDNRSLVVGSKLNTKVWSDLLSSLKDCKQYNKFRGVTVLNSITTSENCKVAGETYKNASGQEVLCTKDGDLVLQLANNIAKNSVYDEAEALDKARDMMRGFANVKTNDAQSYITFEEFIRRVAAKGELEKYRPLIENILDETKPLSAETLNAFVQVQKNFYYDLHYDETWQTEAPRQIKNAEFVLVPRLIKGTELERVYNLMIKHDIDQLNTRETDKASKRNILRLWDNEGNLNEDYIKDFEANVDSSKQMYDYNYLYTQQETPQHMNDVNKAGVQVVKKVLDNITPDSPLYKYKERFFNLFGQHIKNSFKDLMGDLKVKTDKNGNIIFDEDGNPKGLDYKKLFERFQEEIARLGLDENMLDYVTPVDTIRKDGKPSTKMPLYLSHRSSKLMNIAQSVINTSVTRQTLPGFHAAQITDVGFRSLGNKDSIYVNKDDNSEITYEEYSKLSPVQKANYRNKNVSYDTSLRYHPNGKAYAEIKLPKSAFNFAKDENGNYKFSDEELLKQLQEEKLDEIIGYRIPTEGKQSICILKVVGFLDDAYGSTIAVPNDWVAQTGSDFDIDSVYGIQFNTYINGEGKIKKFRYLDDTRKLYIKHLMGELSKDAKTAIKSAKTIQEKFRLAEEYAIKEKKITYNQFKKLDNVELEFNDNKAIENEMLECMQAILRAAASMEENLSRSNFDDISDALKAALNPLFKAEREHRSPYNFLDQAEFQEDAMSGAKLKALSVVRDTFCSVCNTVRPTINPNNTIIIDYSGMEIDSHAIDRFNGKNGIIEHKTIGWSKDDRNVQGKLITAYSSQTTAYILDAVKKGAIPNVNDFTFGVFKLFPDLGSDYITAISFITQPGVTEIVKAYNSTKSVYNQEQGNPIDKVIKQYASKLGINPNQGVFAILEEFDRRGYSNRIGNMFGNPNYQIITKEDEEVQKLTLPVKKLQDRINSTPVENIDNTLFDLGIVLYYRHMATLANGINNYTMVCNPDKFGAKQTMYATRKIFEDINTILQDDNKLLQVDGVDILAKIYPGMNSDYKVYLQNNEKSAYSTLNAFMKYATATSLAVNQGLFLTQEPAFVNAVKTIESMFGKAKRLSESRDNDVEQYFMSYLYSICPTMAKTVTFDINHKADDSGFSFNDEIFKDVDELQRIFGYGYTQTIDFEVQDLDKPSQDEINEFAKLSPAQKVDWIKTHYRNLGIFDYLETRTYNQRQANKLGISGQTIAFKDSAIDISTALNEFKSIMNNTDPFVSLTAFDLVKYAFVVEGFKMRRNGVSQIIDNSALYTDMAQGGTSIVTTMNAVMHDPGRFLGLTNQGGNKVAGVRLSRDYIRGHYESMPEIPFKYVKRTGKTFDLLSVPNTKGLIVVDGNSTNGKILAERYGLNETRGEGDEKYIRLQYGKKNQILYRVTNVNDVYYLTPINKLEANEFGEWSINEANNKWNSLSFYNQLINILSTGDVTGLSVNIPNDAQLSVTDLAKLVSAELEKQKGAIYQRREEKINRANEDFDINQPSYHDAVVKIRDFYSDGNSGSMYLRNNPIARKLKKTGSSNGQIHYIDGRPYWIYRYDMTNMNRNYLSAKSFDTPTEAIKDKTLRNIIEQARTETLEGRRNMWLDNVMVVQPVQPQATKIDASQVMNSSIEEVVDQVMTHVEFSADRVGKIEEREVQRNLNRRGIFSKADVTGENKLEVIREMSILIPKLVKSVNDRFERWDGTNVALDKLENLNSLDSIKKANEYMRIILDRDAILEKYGILEELADNQNDADLNRWIAIIKRSLSELHNAKFEDARKKFVNEYLAKQSKDPMVQTGKKTLVSGYFNTNWLTSWVHDLQESTNPLIQVITNAVQSNIKGAEMEYKDMANKFKDSLDKYISEAGSNFSWDNVIDENGDLIQPHNNKFVEDYHAVKDALDDAIAKYGKLSKEHIVARYEYNKWLYENTEQELIDAFYREKLAIEKNMIDNHFDIYQKFLQLNEELRNATSFLNKSEEGDPTYEEKVRNLRYQIKQLRSGYVYDQATDSFIEKPDNRIKKADGVWDYNTKPEAKALNSYLEDIANLYSSYYDKIPVEGFEEDLKYHREYVENAEKRDANGKPTVPMSTLIKDKQYLKSKRWLAKNTKVEHVGMYDETHSFEEVITNAYRALRSGPTVQRILKTLSAKVDNLMDSMGIIDGRKLSDKQRAAIKTEQLRQWNFKENQPFSDRIFINSAPEDTKIYKAEFYKRMQADGARNEEYYAKVTQINDILVKCFHQDDQQLHTYELSYDDLKELKRLFDELDNIKRTVGSSKESRKAAAKFISKEVNFETNDDAYNADEQSIQGKDARYINMWHQVFERTVYDEEGEVAFDSDGNEIKEKNKYIYSVAKPKNEAKWLDEKKTDAVRILQNSTHTVETQYYYDELREQRRKQGIEYVNKENPEERISKANYNALSNEDKNKYEECFKWWYNQNHVYNPYKHQMEPIQCWTTTIINDSNLIDYSPIGNSVISKPHEGFVNQKFKKDAGVLANFKESTPVEDIDGDPFKDTSSPLSQKYVPNTKYLNPIKQTEQEKEVTRRIVTMLDHMVKTDKARYYIAQRHMPYRVKPEEMSGKQALGELAKIGGWIDAKAGDMPLTEMSYGTDVAPSYPFLRMLRNAESDPMEYNRPKREDFNTDEEFDKALVDYHKKVKAGIAKNKEIHKSLMDKRWSDVLHDFIIEAGRYNAVRETQPLLYFGKSIIDNQEVYKKNLGHSDLEINNLTKEYSTKKQENLSKQYENWMRRVLLNQFKERNGNYTRFAGIAQSLASANYMMLNIKGGIANVTLGETQIIAEAWASEYFDFKSMNEATKLWGESVMSYMANLWSDKADTLPDSLIKMFNAVEFDALSGVDFMGNDLSKYSERIRDVLFSNQSMGEHFMQNRALLAMMLCHRLIEDENAKEAGRTKYRAMSLTEYQHHCHEQALLSLLNDSEKQKYFDWIKKTKDDANKMKDYLWYRKDFSTIFAASEFDAERMHKFAIAKENFKKDAEKKFNEAPTLYSQFKLENGYATFKDDSILASINKGFGIGVDTPDTVTDAFKVLGEFKEKVISVNKKIHGVYDKLGAAQVEKEWWGSLVMQYHKHMYPGMMKRWRRQGYFNESRGTIEKGIYMSIKDFLSLPIDTIQARGEINQGQAMALKGFKNYIKGYFDAVVHATAYWEILPDYDKANLRRLFGEMAGVLSTITLAIVLQLGGDDDKERRKKSSMYNLLVYETDRLASELCQFDPVFGPNELQKLYSSPVAALPIAKDILMATKDCCGILIYGDDYEAYYRSGQYAGELKPWVRVRRRIPLVRQYFSISTLEKNNKYYKLDKNINGVIPTSKIAEGLNELIE